MIIPELLQLAVYLLAVHRLTGGMEYRAFLRDNFGGAQ